MNQTTLFNELATEPMVDRLWSVLQGDCIATLNTLDAGCASLVFVDPPFNFGIDYGDGPKADRLSKVEYADWCWSWIVACESALELGGVFWLLCDEGHADEFGVALRQIVGPRFARIIWHETFAQ